MPYLGYVDAAEIRGPTQNGNSRPLLLKDTEGRSFVVKGMAEPGRAALVSELICMQLAERLGLTVPGYAVMKVPEALIDFSMQPTASNLRGGFAFASEWVEGADDLRFEQVQAVPEELQQRVLLFDVWVGNGDRELSPFGGNVNLLRTPAGTLVVFDHNLAFHMDFPEYWVEDHVFAGQAHTFRDFATRDAWANEIDRVLADWDTILNLVPDEWNYWDGAARTSVTHPSPGERLRWLERVRREPETFWSDL